MKPAINLIDSRLQNPTQYLAIGKAGSWLILNGLPTDEPTYTYKSGFDCDIYEDTNSNKAVIAYRGTDEFIDWILGNLALGFSIQYNQADRVVRVYQERNSHKNVVLVGHSLGGGLALGASVETGLPAVTFNTSPRVFDGLGDKHKPATRVAIFQKGEALEKVRKHWAKLKEVVKEEDIYMCDYDFGGDSAHLIDRLAVEMTKQGAVIKPEFNIILEAIGE